VPSRGSQPSELLGSETPRLATEPLRKLTRKTSRGFEVADFAEQVLGEPLLPWQRWLAIHALELDPAGGYRFRTVVATCARQSGKTSLMRAITLWRLYVDGAKLVLGVAQDLSIARETWQTAVDTAKSIPDLAVEIERVGRVNGDEYLRLVGGGRYKISAANRSAGRGLSTDLLAMDEIREQRSWDAWSALSKTTMARSAGQTWAISTAGDDQSVVLRHLREAGLAGTDPSIAVFEWSAPEGCDLDDIEAWRMANPGMGHTVSVAAIRSALGTDPPNVFRAEVLNQWVDSLDGAIDPDAWRACQDAAGTLDAVRDRVALCLDVSPDLLSLSLVAAAVLDDGRVRVEVVASWDSTDACRRDLQGWLDRVKPRAFGYFPGGPAAALVADLRGVRDAVELKGTEVTAACQGFAELVSSRRLLHPGDARLTAQSVGASKLPSGDGFRFTRKGVGHCDSVYAAGGATHLARTLGPPRPKPLIVVSKPSHAA
jgi:hypothetical protein